MGQRKLHAAPVAGMRKVRGAATVMLTAGALVLAGAGGAFADMLEDLPLSGEENTDQHGDQNLSCGNSARLVRLNIAQTAHREQVCVDDDGHTGSHHAHARGARTVGGTTLGPQTNTAQAGKQNLACGNSADLVTVNVAGTMTWNTTCTTTDHGAQHPRSGASFTDSTEGARALGGTSLGPQVNTAQAGQQNLSCGNSADTLTVNVLGAISKHTTCTATDYSHPGPGEAHRGQATAKADQVVGPETNTAQNGHQNQNCGNPGTGLEIPLGSTERRTRCAVHDGS